MVVVCRICKKLKIHHTERMRKQCWIKHSSLGMSLTKSMWIGMTIQEFEKGVD